MEPRRCSECGRSLDGLMAVDHSKPGLSGLLRGEGSVWATARVARVFVLLVIFALALCCFATARAVL